MIFQKTKTRERWEKFLSRVSPPLLPLTLAPPQILISFAVVGDSLSPVAAGGGLDVLLVSHPSCSPFFLSSLHGASSSDGALPPDLLEIKDVFVSREHWRGEKNRRTLERLGSPCSRRLRSDLGQIWDPRPAGASEGSLPSRSCIVVSLQSVSSIG